MTPLWLVDDTGSDLAPMTDLRAAFDVRTGALTMAERAALTRGSSAGLVVPTPLVDLTRERHPGVRVAAIEDGARGESLPADEVVVMSARWPIGPTAMGVGEPGRGGSLVCASTGRVLAVRGGVAEGVRAILEGRRTADAIERPTGRGEVLSRPWHVRSGRDAALAADLRLMLALRGVEGGAWCAATASVHPSAVLDAAGGPIVIDEHAVVRPGAIVIGPAYVGQHSTVLERATIRANTAIGPRCKVAGEVGGTIFQGWSNKAHDGYVGDSWIGEWVNLGAGTTTSNLLNTYDEVIAQRAPDSPRERTGEVFLGCVLGDHVKTAICTRIMTGAIVHTGAMWAATEPVAGCVPAFAWATDGGVRRYRLAKFVEVARAAMARRSLELSAAALRAIERIHVTGDR